jgi:hypothetical protein
MCNFVRISISPYWTCLAETLWGKMSGFPGALKRTKRQHQQSASCKLYVLNAPAHLKILKGVDRGRMQQSKRKFLQKSVGERFGVG